MFRLNDLILLLVLILSMLAGILFPTEASLFRPYPVYGMIFFLFLSFLSIKLDDIWQTIRTSTGILMLLTVFKMLVLPVAVYFFFKVFYAEYAVSALLLTGVSTGVAAPFVANLVQANSALVLVMVVITSALVPFTLPALVKLLLGQSTALSLTSMIRLLAIVIFIPIAGAETLRRTSPQITQSILNRRFPFALILFAIINLGIFSRYAGFFRQNPSMLAEAIVVAFVLGGIYLVSGLVCLWKAPVESQLAGGVILANMNNVLVIVFSSQFFGPPEATVAAMYMLPFFLIIIPLRMYQRFQHRNIQENLAL
jgi:BASS family bile acid:Na+ symporter